MNQEYALVNAFLICLLPPANPYRASKGDMHRKFNKKGYKRAINLKIDKIF